MKERKIQRALPSRCVPWVHLVRQRKGSGVSFFKSTLIPSAPPSWPYQALITSHWSHHTGGYDELWEDTDIQSITQSNHIVKHVIEYPSRLFLWVEIYHKYGRETGISTKVKLCNVLDVLICKLFTQLSLIFSMSVNFNFHLYLIYVYIIPVYRSLLIYLSLLI